MNNEELIAGARESHELGGNRVVLTCICGRVWPCLTIRLADALEERLKHEEFVSRDANAKLTEAVEAANRLGLDLSRDRA